MGRPKGKKGRKQSSKKAKEADSEVEFVCSIQTHAVEENVPDTKEPEGEEQAQPNEGEEQAQPNEEEEEAGEQHDAEEP